MNNVTLTVTGWLIVAALLYWWSQSKTGHTLIYMALSLVLILLFLSNYKAINAVVFKSGATG